MTKKTLFTICRLMRLASIDSREKETAIDSIHRAAKTLRRLYDLECNGWPKEVTEYRDGKKYRYQVVDEELKARCEKKEASLVKLIAETAKRFGWTVELQGDPRGWPVKLTILSQELGREVDVSLLANY